MIKKVILALVVAVAVGLLCIIVGRVLGLLVAPPAVAVGDFLESFAWVIGLLAGIWYFIRGGFY